MNNDISLTEAQKQVDQWIKTIGVRYFSELTNMAILTEEVGELARIMARKFGDQSFKYSEENYDLGDEMADVLWVLICLANQTGIDLNEAFLKNMEKKTSRDKERHKNNEKLTTVKPSTNNTNPRKWTNEQVNFWFEKQEWLEDWQVAPDASINRRTFAIEYHKNPKRWKQAFTFLQETNLKSLPEGKQELEGENLFIAVSEYRSKDKSDTKYEAHKKYIDIQYVISGVEQMGLASLDKVDITEPYNEEKDLLFYDFEGGEYLRADPTNFFIFFPEDVHRPGIKTGKNVPVKKLVVKLLIE